MHIESVTDPDDPRVHDFRSLTDVELRRAKEPEEGLYIAESEKVIARACAAGHVPRAVLCQERWLPGITQVLGETDVPVYLVSKEVAESVTGYAVHRGALASMHRPALSAVEETIRGAKLVLVLEDIIDHTNIGAAFRAAAGLGADAVLVSPRCADPLYRRAIRVSMGTVFQVPWTRIGDWQEASAILHAEGFDIAALALDERAVPLDAYADNRPERVALLLGTEGDGLSARALENADRTVTIPMSGGVDSLNVAAAVAVAVWALRG